MIGYLIVLLCTSRMLFAQVPVKYTLAGADFELDREFLLMDHDKNGVVDLQEFDVTITLQDKDRNGCVSMKEYFDFHHGNFLKFEWNMFNHFDHNQDGCLEPQDMSDEFHEIDLNPKDGEIEMTELESYYEKLYIKIGVVISPEPATVKTK